MSAFDREIGGGHYKDSVKIQPLDFIVANDLDWCEANVVKYVFRHRMKGGAQDVRKAIHYLELLLEKEYGESYFDTESRPEPQPGPEDPDTISIPRVRLSDESHLRLQEIAQRNTPSWAFWGIFEDLPSGVR